MAKAKVVHSLDACEIVFKGNPKRPEPSTGVITFPGGHVEVSRCSDGAYWAHVHLAPQTEVIETRVEYQYEQAIVNGVGDIPDHEHITHLAVKVPGVQL